MGVQLDEAGTAEGDLFSPEELAMMMDATGLVDDVVVHHELEELQEQYKAVARLVAEGGERERQLRSMIQSLMVITESSQHQEYSVYEQTRNLAQLIINGSERELRLQQRLDELRAIIKRRVDSVM